MTPLFAGLVLDGILMPINKSFRTPSFTLFMTGSSPLAFAMFRHLPDGSAPGVRTKARGGLDMKAWLCSA